MNVALYGLNESPPDFDHHFDAALVGEHSRDGSKPMTFVRHKAEPASWTQGSHAHVATNVDDGRIAGCPDKVKEALSGIK